MEVGTIRPEVETLWLDDDFNYSVHQLKLLRSTAREERVDALAHIAWILFSFQLEEDAWLHP